MYVYIVGLESCTKWCIATAERVGKCQSETVIAVLVGLGSLSVVGGKLQG